VTNNESPLVIISYFRPLFEHFRDLDVAERDEVTLRVSKRWLAPSSVYGVVCDAENDASAAGIRGRWQTPTVC